MAQVGHAARSSSPASAEHTYFVKSLLRVFYGSAVVILIVTASAKLVSATGKARALALPDPLLMLTHREVLVLAGSIELLLAGYLLFGRRSWLKAPLVAWLATNFLIYRLGLMWMGVHKPCSCLGTITDALSIAPATIDLLMKIVLAYLLASGYGLLFIEWWRGRKCVEPNLSALDHKPVT